MLTITPKTKIFDLLQTYPEVENDLIKLVPAFSKLKNPILRNTIARVTTLQQAASVGNVPLGLIINKLREIVGNENIQAEDNDSTDTDSKPVWFKEDKIVKKLDARPLLERGEHPMELVNRECRDLPEGEIFELSTGFLPAPLMDMMKSKGFEVWVENKSPDLFLTYFFKSE